MEWVTAVSAANGLADDACSLTDGSVAGDWRLPDKNELESLLDLSRFGPALPQGHLFTNLQMLHQVPQFWSSTSSAQHSDQAWYVDFHYGSSFFQGTKLSVTYNFIAVRGGL